MGGDIALNVLELVWRENEEEEIMKSNVRQVWDGVVYRLFPTRKEAEVEAKLMGNSKSLPLNLEVLEHASQNGFILRCMSSGQIYDAAGIVQGVVQAV